MFSIDGVEYDVFCDIAREAEIKASEISGILLNKRYYNDVLATYIKYTITLAIPITKMAQYASLYEVLIAPVAQHFVVLPYNNTFIGFNGRIEVVSDRYYDPSGQNQGIWRGTQFEFTVNDPVRLPE